MTRLPVVSVPMDETAIASAVRRCRSLVRRRAMVSAGMSALPIPGLDIAVDTGLVASILAEVNREFGLTPDQIGSMPSVYQQQVFGAITAVGAAFAGKTVTAQLVLKVLQAIGVRLTAKQLSRWVPIAGQVAAAGMSWAAIEWVGRRHIEECERVARLYAGEGRRREPRPGDGDVIDL